MLTFEQFFRKKNIRKRRKKKFRLSTDRLPFADHNYMGDKNYINSPPCLNPPNASSTTTGSYD